MTQLSNSEAALYGFVERLERLDEERAGLGEDIKEVMAEAKTAGFAPAIIRKAIAARRDYHKYKETQEAVDGMLDVLDRQEEAKRQQSEGDGE